MPVARALAVFLLTAGLADPQSAVSQTETELGTRIPSPAPAPVPTAKSLTSKVRAQIVLQGYAHCLVARHYKPVLRILAMPALSREADRAVRDIADPECLSAGELQMNPLLLRESFYVELYRDHYAGTVPIATAASPDFKRDVLDQTAEDAIQYLAVHRFADCAVRADPTDARRIVIAAAASQAQTAAFTSLSSHIGDCAPKGQSVKFGESFLAGLLAEVLYRDAMADNVDRRTALAPPSGR